MDIELVNKIKRLAIVALASDDELIETIVLKGGNAIDFAFNDTQSLSRTSYDLDFSIEGGDFNEDVEVIGERIKRTLDQTFLENNFIIIDYKFISKPKNVAVTVADFWGGYKVTFKVVDKDKYNDARNIDAQRRAAISIKPDNSPTFEIEFSKHEYVGKKEQIAVDGFKIFVYAPEMIVFEKLRAICQQLPQYHDIIKSHSPRPRARDFYDIHLMMNLFDIDINSEDNRQLIKNVFSAKRVPLDFIKEIKNNKSIHSNNWESVKDTISQKERIHEFDFYFEYVVKLVE